MTHTLIQRGPKDFYCTVCRQSWQSPTKAYCPHMPVIAYRDRGPLMSKTEMDKRGYKTDVLPKSTCCFRMDGKEVQYVKLYDPSGCARKKAVKHRLVHYVDVLHWPLVWMPFLERLVIWKQDHGQDQTFDERDEWRDLCFEVARMTSCLLAFTDDELTAIGETVALTFDLMPIRTRYERRRSPDFTQMNDLIEVLLVRYRDWRWATRSPEEIAAQQSAAAAITARRVTEQKAEETVRREKLFQPVHWATVDEGLPPAVQKPLFDESEV